jgi:hypothetical protein
MATGFMLGSAATLPQVDLDNAVAAATSGSPRCFIR